MLDLYIFTPDNITLLGAFTLIILSFFTSMLTAAMGIGGGTVLLAVMAQIVPAKAIVPVHGVVQLGSNTGRALIMLKHVDKPFLLYFALGCIVGALIGGQIAFSLPADILRLTLGLFILFTVWVGATFPNLSMNKNSIIGGGIFTTMLSMFVGATGPLVIAMVKHMKSLPVQLVATSAAALVIQHTLKLVAFGFIGFAFLPYLPLTAAMIATGFLGTLIGKKILMKTPPKKFKLALNILISVLALRLIYEALKNML